MKPLPEVLILSYFFPPLNGPGVQRAFSFTKNIIFEGWKPVVLTVKPVEYVGYDEEMLSELSDIEVIRTESIDPMRLLYILQHIIKKTDRKNNIYHRANKQVKQFWRDIFPIDSKTGWLPFALREAKRIIRTHNIKVIFATMSPYTSGILAYKLSKETGIPYILDYRDLWQGKPDINYFSGLHKKTAEIWERRIIKRASKILHVTEFSAARFLEIYPETDREKVRVIFNGYDKAKFLGIKPLRKDDKLKFCFAGHFYGGQSPENFLASLRKYEDADYLENEIEITFAGTYSPEIEELFHDLKSVKRIPWLKYNDYLQELIDSDVLLLFIAKENSNMVLTQKLFDYLAACKPIMAIVPPDGEAADMINRYKAGIVCGHSIDKIYDTIKEFLNLHKNNELGTRFPLNRDNYKIFERKYQAKQLAEIFLEVIDE